MQEWTRGSGLPLGYSYAKRSVHRRSCATELSKQSNSFAFHSYTAYDVVEAEYNKPIIMTPLLSSLARPVPLTLCSAYFVFLRLHA
jgi:hypothetical protein